MLLEVWCHNRCQQASIILVRIGLPGPHCGWIATDWNGRTCPTPKLRSGCGRRWARSYLFHNLASFFVGSELSECAKTKLELPVNRTRAFIWQAVENRKLVSAIANISTRDIEHEAGSVQNIIAIDTWTSASTFSLSR